MCTFVVKSEEGMKKFLLMVAVGIMTVACAQAQRLMVVDTDGNPVPYATIMTPQAEMIGTTNLDGVFDTKGVKNLVVTHVAFKSKAVEMGSDDASITLDDADFDMPELIVSPKPYIYVQTYYRMYSYSAKDGIVYYRVGLTDNVYDLAKKKMSSSTSHVAKARYGLVKTLLGMLGSAFDRQSHLSVNKLEDRIKSKGKSSQLVITDVAPGKKSISDFKGVVGSVTDDMDSRQRIFAYDTHQIVLHTLEALGYSKALEKKLKRDEKKQNRETSDFCIYHIDEEGNYAPEDFVMMQYLDSYDDMSEGEPDHNIIAMQVFATDRSYVTKSELKARKKANKMKLNYANILQFERDHNIPPLAAAVQKKLNELWKVGE